MRKFAWTKKRSIITIVLITILTASSFGFWQTSNNVQAAILDPHPGLVGLWSFNEGSGTIAGDSSGNGNTGTISGATWITGQYGQALNFNGISDNVNFGHSTTFNTNQAITVSMWLNFEPLSVYGYVLAKAGSYIVYADESGAIHWWIYTTSGNYNLATSGNYADGTWHLVTCTFDSTLSNQQMKIYIDGTLKVSLNSNGAISSSQNNLFLGAYEGSWRPFKGR
jgi:hypothetical protein